MNSSVIFGLAATFFLVTNPIGNAPAILALVKNFEFSRQKWIMLRETVFALLIALFFQYFAEYFLSLLRIQSYAVTLCGGTLLFLVAFHMIFSAATPEIVIEKIEKIETGENGDQVKSPPQQEPFFVPIATPLLSGPGLLTIIMLKSQEVQSHFIITMAILIAWIGVISIMVLAPYLQKMLGKRGMIALEQLMGLVLAMIGMGMLVKGVNIFIDQLNTLS